MPSSGIEEALNRMCQSAVRDVRDASIIGLGSGSTVTRFVRAFGEFVSRHRGEIIAVPSSLQIKLEAEKRGIRIGSDNLIPMIDVTIDGADQIDEKLNMIKGGGGAMLRERVLLSAARESIILADETKFVKFLNIPVPVEVLPFARSIVEKRLRTLGGKPRIRLLEKGYPFLTENGNIILDTDFGQLKSPAEMKDKVRTLPGVIEVGIFDEPMTKFYKATRRGRVEVLTSRKS